jgi:hypothetical protein
VKRATRLAALAILFTPSIALANGRYPAASQLVVDPTDREHIVVSATFGLLESRDGGRSFGWLCEAAIGTSGQQDLMLAVAGNGATVVAMFNGMTTTTDGCSFRAAPELANRTMGDLTISRSSPHQLAAFWLEFQQGGAFASQLVHSDDDGQSWTPVGNPFTPDLYPLTVDIAPSLPSRVYLSARGDKAKNFASMLMRSDDGGATFTSADVPDSEQHRLTFIAAVHPADADRVYLRVDDFDGTVIQMSNDGGRTFQKIFTGVGKLLGFAISPDGTQLAVGGPDDGIWVGASDGSLLARRSDVGVTCLTWTADALYACADYLKAGFSVGRSTDFGATFEGLFRYNALCGRASCGSANTSRCVGEWYLVAPTLGATCSSDAGNADASAGDDGGGNVDREGGAEPVVDADPSGCSVRRARRAKAPWSLLLGLIAAMGSRRRSRARARVYL